MSMKILNKYKGGFSWDIIQSKELKNYILSGSPGGYIGSSGRPSVAIDKYLEQKMRGLGMGSRAIGIWLSSTSGRHLCDDEVTKSRINKYFSQSSPAKEVAMWQDPEHGGTLASSIKLRSKYDTPTKVREALYNIEIYGHSRKSTPDFMKL